MSATLAEHAHLFAVDLPGFGASERREDIPVSAGDGWVPLQAVGGIVAIGRSSRDAPQVLHSLGAALLGAGEDAEREREEIDPPEC